ncbi:MAG: copper resistance protein CopC [Dehalococcoidia bacterium]
MRLVVGLVLSVVSALLVTTAAFAHAEPATAKPGDGAVLLKPPAEIVIVMSQDMFSREGANDIDVLDSTGKEVTTVAAVVDRNDRKRLSVAMPSTLATGTYTVNWKTLSADDGDAAEGSISFTYDPNGTANPGKETLREDLLNPTPTTDSGEAPASLTVAGPDNGVNWILVVAVGIGMFVLGAGGAFLLVQKRT